MNRYLLEAAATRSIEASVVPRRSRTRRWSLGLIAAIGLTASVAASVTTWLPVTDPVTVSHAIATGDAEELLRIIGTALIDIVRTLVEYL